MHLEFEDAYGVKIRLTTSIMHVRIYLGSDWDPGFRIICDQLSGMRTGPGQRFIPVEELGDDYILLKDEHWGFFLRIGFDEDLTKLTSFEKINF